MIYRSLFYFVPMKLNEKETLLVQLALLLNADGKSQKAENKLLAMMADKLKVNALRLIEIIANKDFVDFNFPNTEEARAQNLYALFMMINSDGKITSEEKNLILKLGVQLGFRDEMISELINTSVISNHQLKVDDFIKALGRYNA